MRKRPGHTHTVPAGYLRAFADASALRRNPHVWRFGRGSGEGKLISVRDACVSRDAYTLWTNEGRGDSTIETDLLGATVEDAFPAVVGMLNSGREPDYWQWRDVSRFMAFQLWRTPRMFQLHRDEWTRHCIEFGPNDPQLAMVDQAPRSENWLCWLTWSIWRNGTDFPFLASDNPVAMWADRGSGAELGVGFLEPRLQVLFPLTPTTCLTAAQTATSLEAIRSDPPSREPNFDDYFGLFVDRRSAGINEVVRLNQITVSNAEHYVYASFCDARLRLFLGDLFFGCAAPVRRKDRRPIGSPVR